MRLEAGIVSALLVIGAAAASASAGSTQISASVGGGDPVPIGTITDAPAGPGGINLTFTFAPGYGDLDDWYDFRWINVIVEYVKDGVSLPSDPQIGVLPAIDPKSGGQIPAGGQDSKPFYYTDDEWNSNQYGSPPNSLAVRNDHVSSTFWDKPADGSNDSQITFYTFLVAKSHSDPGIAEEDLCILGGVIWVYDNLPNTATAIGSVVGGSATVNDALANADPAFDLSYLASDDCALDVCPLAYDQIQTGPPTLCNQGDWYGNGVLLGSTFTGGSAIPAGATLGRTVILPAYPDTWKWSCTHTLSGAPRTFESTVTGFGPASVISVPVVFSPMFAQANLSLSVNVAANSYVLAISQGPVLWQGAWSGYPANIGPQFNFQPTGIVRGNRLSCTADLNGDGLVDGADLGFLLSQWNAAGGPADIDASGQVDGADLGALLANWGPCD